MNIYTESFKRMYSPGFGKLLLGALKHSDYHALPYLKWFWGSKDLSVPSESEIDVTTHSNAITLVYLGMIAELGVGLYLIYLGITQQLVGGVPFGLSLILAYPVVWAHIILIPRFVYIIFWGISHPKKAGKSLLCTILEYQVTKLRSKYHFKIVAVAGSVGKTSTKLAIAKLLEQDGKVLYQEGNYNDRLTIPLVVFDQRLPGLFNIIAWAKIVTANNRMISNGYKYDYVIVELGTDGPNQISKFAYLKPELSVVTAVTYEHMEYFGSLDNVANEELAVFDYSKQVLINKDDVPVEYLKGKSYLTYGLALGADYRIVSKPSYELEPSTIDFRLGKNPLFKTKVMAVGKQGSLIALAAAAAASILELDTGMIKDGLASIKPFAGRMQILEGIKQSTIIDDTYNAAPKAVMAALEVLYANHSTQRIAVLGNMNELGKFSAESHELVGEACDPRKLSLVITIGPDANKYLAPVAKKKGCAVKTFDSPYAAGKFVEDQLKDKAIVLVKGSQNRVFAEEVIKTLLKNPEDSKKLVRQSAGWMSIKQSQFPDYQV